MNTNILIPTEALYPPPPSEKGVAQCVCIGAKDAISDAGANTPLTPHASSLTYQLLVNGLVKARVKKMQPSTYLWESGWLIYGLPQAGVHWWKQFKAEPTVK